MGGYFRSHPLANTGREGWGTQGRGWSHTRFQPLERQQVRLRRSRQRAASVAAAFADLARSGDRPGAPRVHLLAVSAWRNVARGAHRASRLRTELSADGRYYRATSRAASGREVVFWDD